jgi:hypothetical protein
MWDFQHTPLRVTGGHPSQYVQQMGDGGPQPIGLGSDTMFNYQLCQKFKLIERSKFNHLTWYQSQRSWDRTLTPSIYRPFKLNIPYVGPHLLKGSLSSHMRGSAKVMVK